MSPESRGKRHELEGQVMSKSGYKDLIAWKKWMELVAAIYDATDGFPPHEMYGLVSQHTSGGGVRSKQYR